MRCSRIALCAAIACFLAIACEGAVPAFLWSNQQTFEHSSGPRVSYETLNAAEFVSRIFKPAVKADPLPEGIERYLSDAAQNSLLVAVHVGNQLRAADLSTMNSQGGALTPLRSALQGYSSSLVLPYIAKGSDALPSSLHASLTMSHTKELVASSMADRLVKAALEAGLMVMATTDCDLKIEGVSVFPILADLAQHTSNEVPRHTLVLTCSPMSGDLASEVAQVAELERYASSITPSRVVMYVVDPEARAANRTLHRSLLATTTPDADCGDKCQVQVDVLEAVLVGIVILIALLSGIVCLNALEGPTKFQAAKSDMAQ